MMANKKYDLVIYGATGFTGRLVAEYLLNKYGVGNELKWAIASRSEGKLKSIRQLLGNENLPVLTADSHDAESLRNLALETDVICTTVGPYAKHGNLLVQTCVAQGVDYCDLTGEVQWIHRMIDAHHENAKNNGVKIVHCCGFDSIPSDMGVYFLQKHAKQEFGEYCQHVKLRVKAAKGGPSGGTIASLNNMLEEAKSDPSIFKLLENPYSLNPKGEQDGPDENDLSGIAYDNDFNAWIGPFIMAAINTRVVRRSHFLAGYPYGKDFQYDEATLCGKGISGKIKARVLSSAIGMMSNPNPNALLKGIADRFLPDPGEGPSKEQRENGFYNMGLIGKLKNGEIIKGKVTGDRDPGYGSTSKMLGESAVCLALDKNKLPKVSGVITPSIAMGDLLLERLQENAGLTFSIL